MNNKVLKNFLMISIMTIFLLFGTVYADAIYPYEFKPTPSYLWVLIPSMTTIIIIGIILIFFIYRSNLKKKSVDESKIDEKQQEGRNV